MTVPPNNPRPIQAKRVWAGIGLAFAGHVLALALGAGLAIGAANTTVGGGNLMSWALPLTELLLFAACLIFGITQLQRGDRGIGVGLLVGWGAGVVILGGGCVALILAISNSLNG